MQFDDVGIYMITHGRPDPKERPTTHLLDVSGLPYHMVMNESQVSDYVAAGVPLEKIIPVTQEWEDEYFRTHRTYKVDFHGAIANREACNVDARKKGLKYAFQLDDNIVRLSYRHFNVKAGDVDEWCGGKFPEWVRLFRELSESTNIGMLGAELSDTPGLQHKILRTGFAYVCFLENVQANIPWVGPFDDDVAHNLQFNHSGKYTDAMLCALGYSKEASSKTGMRSAYEKFQLERPLGTVELYPDHVKIGVRNHSNGARMRYYHKMRKNHQNIKVKDVPRFKKAIADINALCDAYEEACESGGGAE